MYLDISMYINLAGSRAVLAVLCTLLLCSALLNLYFMRPGADTRGQQQQTKLFSFKGESATNHHLDIWRHFGIPMCLCID